MTRYNETLLSSVALHNYFKWSVATPYICMSGYCMHWVYYWQGLATNQTDGIAIYDISRYYAMYNMVGNSYLWVTLISMIRDGCCSLLHNNQHNPTHEICFKNHHCKDVVTHPKLMYMPVEIQINLFLFQEYRSVFFFAYHNIMTYFIKTIIGGFIAIKVASN